MESVIVPIILGILIMILGFYNMKGNINSLHWYHRRRVTEEDRLPFGKKVGLGTIIIGICIIICSVLSFMTELTGNSLFAMIGEGIVLIGIVVGLSLSLYAMIKYNKGIF